MLATAFNTMTAELRETLEGLEKRVADRTEELRLQNAELGALHETTLGVMHRLDVDDLLRELLARACELLGTHARLPLHPQPGGEELENRVATGVFEEELGTRMSLGEGLAGRVWQSGEPLVIEDYDAWEGRMDTFPRGPHPRARRRAAASRASTPSARSAWRATHPTTAAFGRVRGRAPAAVRAARIDRARQRPAVRLGARGARRPPTRRTRRRARSSPR